MRRGEGFRGDDLEVYNVDGLLLDNLLQRQIYVLVKLELANWQTQTPQEVALCCLCCLEHRYFWPVTGYCSCRWSGPNSCSTYCVPMALAVRGRWCKGRMYTYGGLQGYRQLVYLSTCAQAS